MNAQIFKLWAIGLICLAGCGVKGDLSPKGRSEPQPPTGLTLRQQGNSILLQWQAPSQNQDGSPLTDLQGYRIGFYSYQPESYCAECIDQSTIATIMSEQPFPAFIDSQTFYYRDPDLEAGRGYRYRVQPFTRGGHDGPDAVINHIMQPAPPAPVDLKVEALDRGSRIFWSLRPEVQDVGEFLGVNIYRGESGALAPEPINRQPVRGNNFEDFGLINGSDYIYALRTVIETDDDSIIESRISETIATTPKSGP